MRGEIRQYLSLDGRGKVRVNISPFVSFMYITEWHI